MNCPILESRPDFLAPLELSDFLSVTWSSPLTRRAAKIEIKAALQGHRSSSLAGLLLRLLDGLNNGLVTELLSPPNGDKLAIASVSPNFTSATHLHHLLFWRVARCQQPYLGSSALSERSRRHDSCDFCACRVSFCSNPQKPIVAAR